MRILPEIPPFALWPYKRFPVNSKQSKTWIRSTTLAETLISHLPLEQARKKYVVEYNAGLGVLTRSLLGTNKIKCIFLLELNRFSPFLKKLCKASDGAAKLLPSNNSFGQWLFVPPMEIPQQSWDKVHNDLVLTGVIHPSQNSLLRNMVLSIGRRDHVYIYGRVPAVFVVSQKLCEQALATPGSKYYGSFSLMFQALAHVEKIDVETNPIDLFPKGNHWIIRWTPHKESRIKSNIETFNYIIRSLFITRKQSVLKAIKKFAAGAEGFIDQLSFDPSQIVVQSLMIEQVDEIALAFDQWPHRPKKLQAKLWTHKDVEIPTEEAHIIK